MSNVSAGRIRRFKAVGKLPPLPLQGGEIDPVSAELRRLVSLLSLRVQVAAAVSGKCFSRSAGDQ